MDQHFTSQTVSTDSRPAPISAGYASGVREECGIFGIYDTAGGGVSREIYRGLCALQHRGQESCGIAVSSTDGPPKNIRFHKGLGLVSEVFDEPRIASLTGNLGVGHVRYSTAGSTTVENAQPLVLNYIKGTLALAHNGNLVNAARLRREQEYTGALFHTTIDSEVIAYGIARERVRCASVEEAVKRTAVRLEGGYALVITSPRKLIGVRDPYGLKPLCLGQKGSSWILASESCALSSIGAEFVRDIRPGEIVTITADGIHSDYMEAPQARPAHCVFEYIYFARLDSVIDGVSVYNARLKGGAALARSCPADADLVAGVPDSGLTAAVGFSQASGIPFALAFLQKQLRGPHLHQTHPGGTAERRADEIKRAGAGGSGQADRAGGRLHRPRHHHVRPDKNAPEGRSEGGSCADFLPALPSPLLLRDRRSLQPAAHRLRPLCGDGPQPDRRRLPGLPVHGGPGGHDGRPSPVPRLF